MQRKISVRGEVENREKMKKELEKKIKIAASLTARRQVGCWGLASSNSKTRRERNREISLLCGGETNHSFNSLLKLWFFSLISFCFD